jgi:hypothetical protein
MRNGHPSFSSRKAALLAMIGLLSMAGCSGGSQLLSSDGEFLSGLRLNSLMPEKTVSVSPAPTLPPPLRPRIEPAADIKPVSSDEPSQSLWCQHFKEDSAAEATILRSPTLAGSYTDSGKAALDLRLSASSFVRADLVEESALIRCKKYLAESALQKLVFVSPQNLTAAGYRAKSDAILGQKKDVVLLRKHIERAMSNGSIDREKATAITVLTERFLAEGDAAKSQADRRYNEHLMSDKSVNILTRELLQADSDMDNITSRMRTADNMDISVQAGWGDSNLDNGADIGQQAFNGKVSFSLRLGAVDPRRFEHERKSTALKQDALKNAEGGVIWQVGVLRRAHERAISGLVDSQAKIELAMKEARHLLAVLDSVSHPEFEGARLNTRYEIMKLKADRAGIIGSIAEIKSNLRRLQNG